MVNEETPKQRAEETSGGSQAGNQYEGSSLVADANRAAERLEAANKRKEELLAREENLLAQQRLGGRTSGVIETKPVEESPVDYAKRALRNDIAKK